jgi:hypothetical protein
MADIAAVLARWAFDVRQVRERMYPGTEAARARALACALTAGAGVAALLERDAHTIENWVAALDRDGPAPEAPHGDAIGASG